MSDSTPSAGRAPWSWRLGRALMIVAALIYGPVPSLIDAFDPYHLTNPEWNGHARLHLLWLINLTGSIGLTAAWLSWRATPARPEPLRLATLLGGLLIGSFFLAGLLKDLVGGNYGPPSHYVLNGQVGFPLIHFTFAALLLVSGRFLTLRGQRLSQEGPSNV